VNLVTASGGGATSNATASDTATVTPANTASPALLSVTMMHSGNFTQGQNGATYTITVTNTGGTAAGTVGSITVFDKLPPGLTYVSMQGSGWGCASELTTLYGVGIWTPYGGPGCSISPNGLAPGASLPPVTLTFNVASNAASSVTNSAGIGYIPNGIQPAAESASPANDVTTINVAGTSNPPVITVGGVVNAATNLGGAVAPGSWVSIYSTNLSPQYPTGTNWNNSIVNSQLPFTLGGVSVTINNKPAAIAYLNSNQINVQAPTDASTGQVNVVVTTSNGDSAPVSATLAPVAPGLFMAGAYPAAQLANYSGVTASNPAHAGNVVILYGTGFGPTNPPYSTGVAFSGAYQLTNSVTATVGNIPAQVDFAGIVGAGLYQINITIPAGTGTGNVPLVLSINGLQTQSNVSLPIQ
jgi:uncharacterized protein (TIGR03437 family)